MSERDASERDALSVAQEGASVTAALLDELETQGQLIEASASFSIDSARALAKLRDFQLADARAYLLLLVEVAVLAGAQRVDVDIDTSAVRVCLGNLALDRETLEQLFAAVFVDLDAVPEQRQRRRALQKLALACNAALRLDPDAIEIECPDGAGGGLRLTLSDGGANAVVTELEAAPRLSRIRVLASSLAEVVDESAEARLLREHCRVSSVPVFLDGQRVSQPIEYVLHTELSPGELRMGVCALKLRKLVLDEREIGYAALRYGGGLPAELMVLTNGVLAERIMLDEDPQRHSARDFMAVVDLDLPKDLGQTKLLRGPELDAVLELVWATHDEIAPAPVSADEPPLLPPGQPEREFDFARVGIPIAVACIGAMLLWSSADNGGVQGTILVAFSIALIVASLVALVRGWRAPG